MTGAIFGKIIIEGKIRVKTGLHIGAQREAMEIGGIDNIVIKDPTTGLPYIPGSSLKGKLRSLFEKKRNAELPEEERGIGKFFNRNVGTEDNKIWIHVCDKYEESVKCPICRLFGSSGGREVKGELRNKPSRTIFRDAFVIGNVRPDEVVEIKYETSIDRITSAANPRGMERVVPGTEFAFEVVYNIEDEKDKEEDLRNLLSLMRMLEDDYLGGSGSRGYGKVEILITKIVERSRDFYLGESDEKVLFESKDGERVGEVIGEVVEKLKS